MGAAYEEYYIHQIKEYIKRRVLKSKKAIHEDTLFHEIYRQMKHLKAWFDINDLFNRATKDLLREEMEITLDEKGYWRKAQYWNADFSCARVLFPFGAHGFRCADKDAIFIRIKREPFSRAVWNLIPGEETTAMGLFSRPLEFVGYEEQHPFVHLYFYAGEKDGRHFFIEIPIIFTPRKVRIGGEMVESPFQFFWASPGGNGGIDIPYIPGKGWKMGGRKVEKPFVKDGVLL